MALQPVLATIPAILFPATSVTILSFYMQLSRFYHYTQAALENTHAGCNTNKVSLQIQPSLQILDFPLNNKCLEIVLYMCPYNYFVLLGGDSLLCIVDLS